MGSKMEKDYDQNMVLIGTDEYDYLIREDERLETLIRVLESNEILSSEMIRIILGREKRE